MFSVLLLIIVILQSSQVLELQTQLDERTEEVWTIIFLVNLSLRSHCTRQIFNQQKNLNGYVFHTEPFNIFALFTWNIEWHLNYGMVKVVPCEQNTLTREFSAGQKFRPVPCECRDRLVN